MYAVTITEEGGAERRLEFSSPEVTVGRVQGNDIVLPKRNVSKQHARILLKDGRPIVVDLNSTNGTWVNGRKITSPLVLEDGDQIYIADFVLKVEPVVGDSVPPKLAHGPTIPASAVPLSESLPPSALPAKPAAVPSERDSNSPSRPASPKGAARQHSGDRFRLDQEPAAPVGRQRLSSPLGLRVMRSNGELGPLGTLMARLAERFHVHDVDAGAMHDQSRWTAAQASIAETIQSMQSDGSLSADADTRVLAQAALSEAVGLGALDEVLSNEDTREIVVRGTEPMLVDTGEGLQTSTLRFSSKSALQTVTRRLAAQTGQVLGKRPIFHGVLSFGPHVTIVQPPLAVSGPVIEIRVGHSVTLQQLTAQGWLSQEACEYLQSAIATKQTIAVVGPQDAGVTTLLSALARLIPTETRVIAIEAIPDLDIDRTKVISLAAGDTELELGEVIRQGSRLRAERFIFDDLMGGDVIEALSALTGRERGHLLGVHGPGERDGIESLLLWGMACGRDRTCMAHVVSTTIQVVIEVRRTPKGRRITAIYYVNGAENDRVLYSPVAV